MIAGGRDPKVLHSSQYDLSDDSGSRLLIIDTSLGRTIGKDMNNNELNMKEC